MSTETETELQDQEQAEVLSKATQMKLRHLEEVLASQTRVDELEGDWQDKKAVSDAAKKRYEAAVKEHHALIRRRPEQLPLFPDTEGEAAAAPTNAWRDLDIEELGLTESLAQKLIDAGLDKLGKFQDHVAEHGDFWQKDIHGIGEAAAEKVADAFADFFKRHPEYCQEPGESAAEPEPADDRLPSRIRLKTTVNTEDQHVKAGTEHGVIEYGDGFLSIETPDGNQYDIDSDDYDVIEWLDEPAENSDAQNTDDGSEEMPADAADGAITEEAAVA